MSCRDYHDTFICKECKGEQHNDRLKTRYIPRGWEGLCSDCLDERSALLSRKQILRKVRFKFFYMLVQAVRLEIYRLKREREYRNCPRSIPEDRHQSSLLYSMFKIQMRIHIHKFVEKLMIEGCIKCGSKWKLKGVCDGPDSDGPSYYTYCRNCDSGFSLDYDRRVTCVR